MEVKKTVMDNKAGVPVERTKEQIKYATEVLRWYIVIFIALASGEINLLVKEEISYTEYLFKNVGIIITLGICIAIYYHNRYIYTLIKKVK